MPRQIAAPLILMSMPQSCQIEENVGDAGNKVVQMMVSWPMVTVMIEFDKDSGLALAERFREIFGSGLHIAHDLPPSNGEGPFGTRPA